MYMTYPYSFFFFFNDTATTEIYTLSLHDALPISRAAHRVAADRSQKGTTASLSGRHTEATKASPASRDRKSTRLNSSHLVISYAVFCLKKKNKTSETRFVLLEQLIRLLYPEQQQR